MSALAGCVLLRPYTQPPKELLVRPREAWGARRVPPRLLAPRGMGRRSSKIAARKGAQAARKMKRNQRIGKQIAKAVRDGGPNPASNLVLASLLQQARECNYPKEHIDKHLRKATDKDQQDYTECIYEAYGFGGVGLVMEALTDNPNRAFASIRDVVKKSGAKMADSGSVMFGFKRAGVIAVRPGKVDADHLLLAAMDAGAEDLIGPEPCHEEDTDESAAEERHYKVVMPVEEFGAVKTKLSEAGISMDLESSGLEFLPVAPVEVDDEAMELNRALTDMLLELEDVDAVYSTQKQIKF
ncbi:probable transcriptional regulatory protein At2g25830 [Selaginella moellendorffii]|nr:probable transcriptional regulatory protein At2g25830 [Selaginella moellendorffii]|eukprot:XP_002984129.2 probable transcriptional regulatory protein At2g25830 [Selaginella moellendorffii]